MGCFVSSTRYWKNYDKKINHFYKVEFQIWYDKYLNTYKGKEELQEQTDQFVQQYRIFYFYRHLYKNKEAFLNLMQKYTNIFSKIADDQKRYHCAHFIIERFFSYNKQLFYKDNLQIEQQRKFARFEVHLLYKDENYVNYFCELKRYCSKNKIKNDQEVQMLRNDINLMFYNNAKTLYLENQKFQNK